MILSARRLGTTAATSWAPRLLHKNTARTFAANNKRALPESLRVHKKTASTFATNNKRRLATFALPETLRAGGRRHSPLAWKAAAGLTLCGLAQVYLGEGTDIFEHRFTTNKNPDDLSDFYGTEDFMEVRYVRVWKPGSLPPASRVFSERCVPAIDVPSFEAP